MNTPYSQGYAVVILRSIDLFVAGIIWRDYDITISAHCGLELRKPSPRLWARLLGAVLNKIQTNHCELAIAADKERAQGALSILGAKP